MPASEPTIRVGIVLPEDSMTELQFVLPSGQEYRIAGDTGEQLLRPDEPSTGTAHLLGGRVTVTIGVDRRPLVVTGEKVTVQPTTSQPLARGGGLLVKRLVAGRGFHWQKRIDQILLGSIQVYTWDGDRLVVVNELPVEQYLAGVITGEMSSECPLEFMKAQTVAARSWFYAAGRTTKHAPLPFTHCNDDCCQRYQGTAALAPRAIRAIEETRGEIGVASNGNVLNANYSKSCGGILADPVAIWGGPTAGQYSGPDAPDDSSSRRFFPVTNHNAREYLTGDWTGSTDIYCSASVVPEEDLPRYLGRVDVAQHYFRWTVRYSRTELEEILRKKVPLEDLNTLTGLIPGARESSGRLTDLTVTYLDKDKSAHEKKVRGQFNIRDALHASFLYSSAFVIDTTPGDDGYPAAYILHGGGWGHGAGLCQIGALGMALKGHLYTDILHHYFRDITFKKAYP